MQACADEFLDMVTEGVVHCAYKIATQLSFGPGGVCVGGGGGCVCFISPVV